MDMRTDSIAVATRQPKYTAYKGSGEIQKPSTSQNFQRLRSQELQVGNARSGDRLTTFRASLQN